MTEPSELDVDVDTDCVDADGRAGVRPDDSTMSTRDVITPNVWTRKKNEEFQNYS